MKPKPVKKVIFYLFILFFLSVFARYGAYNYFENNNYAFALSSIVFALGTGGYIIFKLAYYIEDITAVLKNKTGLAGGLLQALGTAFPDMVIGITAAFMSLRAASGDSSQAINYAIIATSTTFGSNIYNIGYGAWSMWRQNLANRLHKNVKMFPIIGGGEAKPMHEHPSTPRLIEMNLAIKILSALTVLTMIVALSMVTFGKIVPPHNMNGDFYQLKPIIGFIIIIAVLIILFAFRKNYGTQQAETDNPFTNAKSWLIWLTLLISAATILLAAESMVEALVRLSALTHIPVVVSGMITALIGCLVEMAVIHNFTVNPQGKIGDAIVGVAMDNILTILGASIIALIGGIYLGGDSLIIIFVIILGANSILIWQVSDLKDEYIKHNELRRMEMEQK